MFTKAQLIERGSHYFDSKNVNKMYATTDGNFFYEQDKNYADSHAKGRNLEVIEITRDDLSEKKAKEKPKSSSKPKEVTPSPSDNGSLSIEELRAEGKRLKIPKYWIIKEETLKQKIEEANGTE